MHSPTLLSRIPKTFKQVKNLDVPPVSDMSATLREYVRACVRLGYAVYVDSSLNTIAYVKTRRGYFPLYLSLSILNDSIAIGIADNKRTTNGLLRSAGLPIPAFFIVKNETLENLTALLRQLQFPVVAKPSKGTHKGQDVVTNIANTKQATTIVESLLTQYPTVLVQEHVTANDEYRILAIDGKVVEVVKRIPAYVVGDGVHTVQQLIHAKNALRKASGAGAIKVDAELKQQLIQARRTLKTIPKKNQHVRLKNVCNFGAGGELVRVTGKVHPSIHTLTKKVAETSGLRLMGLDVMADDMTKKVTGQRFYIIEINAQPDILMHGHDDFAIAERIAEKVVRATYNTYK